MFVLRRFRWKRRRAALTLLPAAALMVATGFANAALGTVPGGGAVVAGSPKESNVKLKVKRHVKRGQKVKARGWVSPPHGRVVVVKVNGRKVGKARTNGNGAFKLRWKARRAGVYKMKAIARGTARATRAAKAKKVNVYRKAEASYYGPGLYGNGTACGGRLTPSKLGVAHKRLPCGSKVTFRHRGNTVTVPVIDRGPFAGNREYDLTAATKRKLGFGSTGTVLTTK